MITQDHHAFCALRTYHMFPGLHPFTPERRNEKGGHEARLFESEFPNTVEHARQRLQLVT